MSNLNWAFQTLSTSMNGKKGVVRLILSQAARVYAGNWFRQVFLYATIFFTVTTVAVLADFGFGLALNFVLILVAVLCVQLLVFLPIVPVLVSRRRPSAKHGTDAALFEEDLKEAEHNIHWYEDSIAEIRDELKGLPSAPTGKKDGETAPPPAKRGFGSVLVHSVSFVAGAVFGSLVKGRSGAKESSQDKSKS